MKKNRCFVCLLVLLLACTILPSAKAETVSTGNAYVDEFVNYALSLVGKSKEDLGLGGSWCGAFVNYCANNCEAGQYIPHGETAHNLSSAYYPMKYGYLFDAQTYYFFDDMASELAGSSNCQKCDINTFEPRPGDIVTLRRLASGDINGGYKYRWAHVGIVYKVTDTTISIVHGNWGSDGKVKVTDFKRCKSTTVWSYADESKTSKIFYYYCPAGYTRPAFPEEETGISYYNICNDRWPTEMAVTVKTADKKLSSLPCDPASSVGIQYGSAYISGDIPVGVELHVTETVENHVEGHIWYHVTYNGISGWFYSDYCNTVWERLYYLSTVCEISNNLKLNAEPYQDSEQVFSINSSNRFVHVSGIVENQYGNKWYKVDGVSYDQGRTFTPQEGYVYWDYCEPLEDMLDISFTGSAIPSDHTIVQGGSYPINMTLNSTHSISRVEATVSMISEGDDGEQYSVAQSWNKSISKGTTALADLNDLGINDTIIPASLQPGYYDITISATVYLAANFGYETVPVYSTSFFVDKTEGIVKKTFIRPAGSVQEKIAALKTAFPDGWYWNKWDTLESVYTQYSYTIDDHSTYVSNKRGAEAYGGFSYWGSWHGTKQTGFARMLFDLMWDMDTETESYQYYSRTEQDDYFLDYLEPGDLLRTVPGGKYKYYFITDIIGDDAYYAACNLNGYNQISWDCHTTLTALREELKSSTAENCYMYTNAPKLFNTGVFDWTGYQVTGSSKVFKCSPFEASTPPKTVFTLSTGEYFYAGLNRAFTDKNGNTWYYCATTDGRYGWLNWNGGSGTTLSDVPYTGEINIDISSSSDTVYANDYFGIGYTVTNLPADSGELEYILEVSYVIDTDGPEGELFDTFYMLVSERPSNSDEIWFSGYEANVIEVSVKVMEEQTDGENVCIAGNSIRFPYCPEEGADCSFGIDDEYLTEELNEHWFDWFGFMRGGAYTPAYDIIYADMYYSEGPEPMELIRDEFYYAGADGWMDFIMRRDLASFFGDLADGKYKMVIYGHDRIDGILEELASSVFYLYSEDTEFVEEAIPSSYSVTMSSPEYRLPVQIYPAGAPVGSVHTSWDDMIDTEYDIENNELIIRPNDRDVECFCEIVIYFETPEYDIETDPISVHFIPCTHLSFGEVNSCQPDDDGRYCQIEYCDVCGEWINTYWTDYPIHTHFRNSGMIPTETSYGFTDSEFCSVCWEMYLDQEYMEPLESAAEFRLPSELQSIEPEAFEDISAVSVYINDGCESIGSRAFADSDSLRLVFIPESVDSIADDAFTGSYPVVLVVVRGSDAFTYAENCNDILGCITITSGEMSAYLAG